MTITRRSRADSLMEDGARLSFDGRSSRPAERATNGGSIKDPRVARGDCARPKPPARDSVLDDEILQRIASWLADVSAEAATGSTPRLPAAESPP